MKRNKRKEAKFFCESCGSEVPGNAKICPVCGKFFASVRCPKCGRTGTSDEFKNGCPTCGYAVDLTSYYLNNGMVNPSAGRKKTDKQKTKSLFYNKLKNLFFSDNKSDDNKGAVDSSLPLWVYILTILIFLILVFCLYSCL